MFIDKRFDSHFIIVFQVRTDKIQPSLKCSE